MTQRMTWPAAALAIAGLSLYGWAAIVRVLS